MPKDILWQMFTDTGDPLCWLWLRAAHMIEDKKNTAWDSSRAE